MIFKTREGNYDERVSFFFSYYVCLIMHLLKRMVVE